MTMIGLEETKVASVLLNKLQEINFSCSIKAVACIFEWNFKAQATYLKSTMEKDMKKVVLVFPLTRLNVQVYAILEREEHEDGDEDVKDSFSLRYSFDEKDSKGADKTISINDPEFMNIVMEVQKTLNRIQRVTQDIAYYEILTLTPMETIVEFISACKHSGTNLEIELPRIFQLILVNGETDEDTTVSLLPGEEIKTIIKSDSIVTDEEVAEIEA